MKITTDKAPEIADAIARSAVTVTGSLVIIQRADGAFDVGYAGPLHEIGPLLAIADGVERYILERLGPGAKTERSLKVDERDKTGKEN